MLLRASRAAANARYEEGQAEREDEQHEHEGGGDADDRLNKRLATQLALTAATHRPSLGSLNVVVRPTVLEKLQGERPLVVVAFSSQLVQLVEVSANAARLARPSCALTHVLVSCTKLLLPL